MGRGRAGAARGDYAVPTAGLDLDPGNRWAGLWSVEPLHGLRDRWGELWPGWTLEFWGDDWARQAVHDPDRLYDSLTPLSNTRHRALLAERMLPAWPIRAQVSAEHLAMFDKVNFGGLRDKLAAHVTEAEIEAAATLIRDTPG